MFAHLNQNLMNNFSVRYIHERGTFDCGYDRCIPFGIFALHFCKTRTFVTLGYDALSSCTEINTIFRALCTYQWPWPMQKSNLISSVLFFFLHLQSGRRAIQLVITDFLYFYIEISGVKFTMQLCRRASHHQDGPYVKSPNLLSYLQANNSDIRCQSFKSDKSNDICELDNSTDQESET